MRWQTLPTAARVLIVLVVGVVTVNVAIGAIDAATRGADPAGAESDPTSTAPDGTSAWVELLEIDRGPIEVRTALPSAPDPERTIVMLDVDADDDEAAALHRFVTDGGWLVAGGPAASLWLGLVVEGPPVWKPKGVQRAVPLVDVEPTEGVRQIEAAGDGSWDPLGSTTATLGDDGTVIASITRLGAGTVVALADPSIVHNRFLAEADNAAFALGATGDGAVTFVDTRIEETAGLAAIPDRWKIALGGLAIAFVLGAVAFGRRIGPPDPSATERRPPRHAYVDAVGLALERTRRPADALVPLQRHVRAGLARRAGLGVDVDDGQLRDAGMRLGWPPEEIDAVLAPATSATVLDAGRALARLTAHGGNP